MPITIKINKPEQEPKSIKIKVGEQKADKPTQTSIVLQARRTLDGNVMIFDHKDIDIVVMTSQKKVVTFAKDLFGDHVYEAQDRLFRFLIKKGVIDYGSVQGGNIYSSMEAKILESKDYNSVQMTLFTIGKFIEDEKPYFEFEKAYDAEFEQRLLEPSPEESTDFDPEKYHDENKGSIRPGVRPFGIANIYRLQRCSVELLYFVLCAFGMTTILVYGSIFNSIRPKSGKLGELFHCPLCTGFWVGVFLWSINGLTERFSFDYNYIDFLLLGSLSSGSSYVLHSIVGDFGLRSEKMNNIFNRNGG